MSRQNGRMSAAAVGLLVLVGCSSLVLYTVLSQHLEPTGAVARPHILRVSKVSPSPDGGAGAGSEAAGGSAQSQLADTRAGFGPVTTALMAAALIGPSPSGAATPLAPVAAGPTASPSPTPVPEPSTSPQPEPSPTTPEPTPTPSATPTPVPTDTAPPEAV